MHNVQSTQGCVFKQYLCLFANHTRLFPRSRLTRQWWRPPPEKRVRSCAGGKGEATVRAHLGWRAGTSSEGLVPSSPEVPGWALVPQPHPSSESARIAVSRYVLRLLGDRLSAAFHLHLYKVHTKLVCNWHIGCFRDEGCHLCLLNTDTHHYLVRDLRKKLPFKKETVSDENIWTSLNKVMFIFPRLYAPFFVCKFGENSPVHSEQIRRSQWELWHYFRRWCCPAIALSVLLQISLGCALCSVCDTSECITTQLS